MAEGERQNRSSRKVQGFNVAAWDTAKDPVDTAFSTILVIERWLDLPRSLSSINLDGKICKLLLPFKSKKDEFKI